MVMGRTGDNAPSVGEQNNAGWGQLRIASGTIKCWHADLCCEIADQIANDRLRAMQFLNCG